MDRHCLVTGRATGPAVLNMTNAGRLSGEGFDLFSQRWISMAMLAGRPVADTATAALKKGSDPHLASAVVKFDVNWQLWKLRQPPLG